MEAVFNLSHAVLVDLTQGRVNIHEKSSEICL